MTETEGPNEDFKDARREQRLDQARDRMTGVALNLAQLLGPIDAASVLLGASATLLLSAFGPEHARRGGRKSSEEGRP